MATLRDSADRFTDSVYYGEPEASGAGGGAAVGDTVTTEQAYGQLPAPGISDEASRVDHTHGTPALPTTTDIGAADDEHTHPASDITGLPAPATAVVSETAFDQSPAVGTSLDYARADHTHGTPATPTLPAGPPLAVTGLGFAAIEPTVTEDTDEYTYSADRLAIEWQLSAYDYYASAVIRLWQVSAHSPGDWDDAGYIEFAVPHQGDPALATATHYRVKLSDSLSYETRTEAKAGLGLRFGGHTINRPGYIAMMKTVGTNGEMSPAVGIARPLTTSNPEATPAVTPVLMASSEAPTNGMVPVWATDKVNFVAAGTAVGIAQPVGQIVIGSGAGITTAPQTYLSDDTTTVTLGVYARSLTIDANEGSLLKLIAPKFELYNSQDGVTVLESTHDDGDLPAITIRQGLEVWGDAGGHILSALSGGLDVSVPAVFQDDVRVEGALAVGASPGVSVVLDGDARLSDARTPVAHSHAQGDVTNLTTDLSAKAPLASPTFTGTPAAPTAAAGTNTTQVATTAFVNAEIAADVPSINAKVAVKKAGTVVGTRRGVNLIEGTNITLTVADDAGNEEVDVTIASASGGVGGSGTTGKLPKWTGSAALGDSIITESSSKVGINTTSPNGAAHVLATTGTTMRLEGVGTIPDIIFNAALGTPGSKTAITTNIWLGGQWYQGYNGTSYATASGAYVAVIATQNWTSANNGCEMWFGVTPNNTSTAQTVMRLTNDRRVRLNDAADIITGSGAPEGVVTATVGSLFLRTNGGAGTTLYVKESGTGNTGWAAK